MEKNERSISTASLYHFLVGYYLRKLTLNKSKFVMYCTITSTCT